MGYESHVGLVDSHAEGDGGNHDHAVFGKKAVLVAVSHRLIHAGMIGQRGVPARTQALRRSFGFIARQRVDDAGLPGMPVQQAVDLP